MSRGLFIMEEQRTIYRYVHNGGTENRLEVCPQWRNMMVPTFVRKEEEMTYSTKKEKATFCRRNVGEWSTTVL